MKTEKIIITRARRITYVGMLTATGILLPFICAHGIGIPGTILLPMHIPVLLIGFLCGPLYGMLSGVLIPVLNSVLTGMPSFYPLLPMMICELSVYGLSSGILYGKTRLGGMRFGIYPALILSMVLGRLASGAALVLLMQFDGQLQALSVWNAVVTGLPGIALQLALVPAIVLATRSMLGEKRSESALNIAISEIRKGTVSCVVMKNGKIVKSVFGHGVAPLTGLLESGDLAGAFVADKIIGKAAAMILVLGGVKEAYGETMSFTAKSYLQAHHIKASSGRLIDVISNREGNGMCPMERSVMDIDDPAEGLRVLRITLEALRKSA